MLKVGRNYLTNMVINNLLKTDVKYIFEFSSDCTMDGINGFEWDNAESIMNAINNSKFLRDFKAIKCVPNGPGGGLPFITFRTVRPITFEQYLRLVVEDFLQETDIAISYFEEYGIDVYQICE